MNEDTEGLSLIAAKQTLAGLRIEKVYYDEVPRFRRAGKTSAEPRACKKCAGPYRKCNCLCKDCGYAMSECICVVFDEEEQGGSDTHRITGLTSVNTEQTEADFDRMVTLASVPTLASLFQKGVESGVLEAQHHYQ